MYQFTFFSSLLINRDISRQHWALGLSKTQATRPEDVEFVLKSDKMTKETNVIVYRITPSGRRNFNVDHRIADWMNPTPENYLFDDDSSILEDLKDAIIVNDALKRWILDNYDKISKKDYTELEPYDKFHNFEEEETIGQPLIDSLSARGSITLSSFIGSAHVKIIQIPKSDYVRITVLNSTNLPSGDLTKEITERLFPDLYFLKPVGIIRDPQKSLVLERQESCSNISQTYKFKMSQSEIENKQWFNGLLDLLEREFKETKDDVLKHIKDIENKLIEFVK